MSNFRRPRWSTQLIQLLSSISLCVFSLFCVLGMLFCVWTFAAVRSPNFHDPTKRLKLSGFLSMLAMLKIPNWTGWWLWTVFNEYCSLNCIRTSNLEALRTSFLLWVHLGRVVFSKSDILSIIRLVTVIRSEFNNQLLICRLFLGLNSFTKKFQFWLLVWTLAVSSRHHERWRGSLPQSNTKCLKP